MGRGQMGHPFLRLLRPHRARYAWGLLSLLGVDLINVALPLVVKEGVDALHPGGRSTVLWAAWMYLGLMVVQAFGRYAWRIFLIGSSHYIARDLRSRLYSHLQRLPVRYYQSMRAGDLMSRASNDIESVRMAVGPGILVSADAILMFTLIIPVMFWQSPKLSLLAFCFYPLVPWITARIGKRIDALFEGLQTRMSQLGAFVQENFAGVRLVKSLVLELTVQKRFEAISREYRKQGLELARYEAAFSPTLSLLTNLGTFLILIVGGHDVLTGAITLGTFIAFQRFVVQLSWPMEAIGWTVTMSREGLAALRRVDEVLNAAPVESVRAPEATRRKGDEVLSLDGLRFSHEQFHLDLDHLGVRRGSKIGIVGQVGSGKSTLFALIQRLYEPPPGTVFLDGRDVLSIPLEELRRRVATVEQQVFLFSEPVESNVTLGARRSLAAGELERLARVAAIESELAALPGAENARLGERGVNLSGGQKQRVALMRALARHPEILLLDDCFSAVDVDVEHRIIEGFLESYRDLTVLLASHRLSIMPLLDEVWVLERGRLVDRGTHAELIARSDLYEQLWRKSSRDEARERYVVGVDEAVAK